MKPVQEILCWRSIGTIDFYLLILYNESNLNSYDKSSNFK